MAITNEDVLKKLSMKRQRKQFEHKTKYGRALPEQRGYDRQAHEEYFQRIKNTPYDPRTWE